MTAIDIDGSSWRRVSGTPGESGERHGEGETATRSISFGSTGPFHSPSASYGAGHTVHKEEGMTDYNEQTLMEAVIKRVPQRPTRVCGRS
jgi:hypothetical protein